MGKSIIKSVCGSPIIIDRCLAVMSYSLIFKLHIVTMVNSNAVSINIFCKLPVHACLLVHADH